MITSSRNIIYYNPSSDVNGGWIVTEDIHAICYESEDIVLVQAEEIRSKQDIGGENPLLLCRYCFDKGFEILCSDGRTNTQ